MPFAPALRNGEAVRLTVGGVWVLDGGLDGRFIEGLSHDEKKSSLGSEEVSVPSVGAETTISLTTTSSGYLSCRQIHTKRINLRSLTL